MQKQIRIKTFYPNFFGDKLIAYVSLRIVLYFNNPDVQADIMGYSSKGLPRKFRGPGLFSRLTKKIHPYHRKVYHDAIPPGLIWAFVRRLLTPRQMHAIAEWRFYSSLHKGDVVYLWPESTLKLYKRVKSAGYFIVSERINTLLANSKCILDSEYASLGLEPLHAISNDSIEAELSCMKLSDCIFSPSPGVTESILQTGIPPSKILQSTYGLEEHEVLLSPGPTPANRPVTAIFVGTICVRKGIHILLKAWEMANIKARLIIVGNVAKDAESILKTALQKNSDIQQIDFVDDLKPIYRNADMMILPSLEEGSPLVTYLALGAGLPLLVSPMGAGGIIEDGVEGFIIEPHDSEGLAQAIKTLVTDPQLRFKMAKAARAKAPEFVWEKVAARRLCLLLGKLADHNLAKGST